MLSEWGHLRKERRDPLVEAKELAAAGTCNKFINSRMGRAFGHVRREGFNLGECSGSADDRGLLGG